MTKAEYIENIKLLNYYTEMYDAHNPVISDEEWDDLYFDCYMFEQETGYIDPNSPISHIHYNESTRSNLKKVTHDHLMLSLAKTKDIRELTKWCGVYKILAMLKCDGLTCSLHYNNGKLVSAETRGNGKVGEDITANALRVKSIPKTISYKDPLVVDGEIICKTDDFEEFSNDYANPRNFATGSIGLDDPDECERRNLTFVVWDKISGEEDLNIKLDIVEQLGFVVVYREFLDIDHIEEQQQHLKNKAAELNIPIDGIVYKINDYKEYMSKGYNEHDFAGGIAFKFSNTYYDTELVDLKWSVGKTGAITPIAVVKPVVINGSTIQKASLHNLTIMKNTLGEHPYVGQPVKICLANEIIPQLKKII